MIGPVDYIVVGFEGSNFDGSILKEIGKASDKKIIRVLDLVFIIKDKDGHVVEGEFAQQTNALKKTFGNFVRDANMPLLTLSDISKIGEQMTNDSAVAVLVFEHLWARKIKKEIMDAGGQLVADGRIHPEAVEGALRELEFATV